MESVHFQMHELAILRTLHLKGLSTVSSQKRCIISEVFIYWTLDF
jgi:hypothetical protein